MISRSAVRWRSMKRWFKAREASSVSKSRLTVPPKMWVR
jgi:hypothetical protein